MPRWLIIVGRLTLILPAVIGLGLLTWVCFLYPGIRMRNKWWLLTSAGFFVLAIVTITIAAIESDTDSATPGLVIVAIWLAGIVAYAVGLKWWLPWHLPPRAVKAFIPTGQPTPPPVAEIPVVRNTPPPNASAAATTSDVNVAVTIEQPGRPSVATPPGPPMHVSATPTAPSSEDPTSTMVFFSHASGDHEVAERLARALEDESVRTWMASRDISIGANYAEELTRNLTSSKYVLVVLSPEAIASPHVRREVNMAIDKGIALLPVNVYPSDDFMVTLPGDWTYWLSLAQVVPNTDERATAASIVRRIRSQGRP